MKKREPRLFSISQESLAPKPLTGFNVKPSTSLIMHSDMCLRQRSCEGDKKDVPLNLRGEGSSLTDVDSISYIK